MEFDSQLPIYQQIKDYVKHQIASGVYEPGQSLPSRRELARTLKINPNTVQKAFSQLEEEGVIVTMPNTPSQVTADEKVIEDLRSQIVIEAIQNFYETVAPFGYSASDLRKFYEDFIKQKRSEEDDWTKIC